MKISCKKVIQDFINKNEGWHKKAHLYAVAEDWLAETVGRACRDLEEEGSIQKSYYDGKYAKGLVQYASLKVEKPQVKKPIIIQRNGEYIAVI